MPAVPTHEATLEFLPQHLAWTAAQGPLLAVRALEHADSAAAAGAAAIKPSHQPLRPPQALLVSALVPGGSQIHDGKLRGYVMLGVEVGAWFAYQSLHSGGKDRDEAARGLANSAYGVRTYVRNARDNGVPPAEVLSDSLQLEQWIASSPSEFYDNIAHDPELLYGWSDYENANGHGMSLQHDTFVKRRDDANRLLKHANALLSGVLLNHIVSAFDAYRAARNYERQMPMGVRMHMDLAPFSGRGSVRLMRHF